MLKLGQRPVEHCLWCHLALSKTYLLRLTSKARTMETLKMPDPILAQLKMYLRLLLCKAKQPPQRQNRLMAETVLHMLNLIL